MLVNLTPHEINIYDEDNTLVRTVKSSGVARVQVKKEKIGDWCEIPFFRGKVGQVEGLPEQNGDMYIVSLMVFNATDRDDVVSPGELVRNEAGQPIGCIGLNCK